MAKRLIVNEETFSWIESLRERYVQGRNVKRLMENAKPPDGYWQ